MQLFADKPCASDDDAASVLADETRLVGKALRVAVDDGPLLAHRAKHRRISRYIVRISGGLQPASRGLYTVIPSSAHVGMVWARSNGTRREWRNAETTTRGGRTWVS